MSGDFGTESKPSMLFFPLKDLQFEDSKMTSSNVYVCSIRKNNKYKNYFSDPLFDQRLNV